MKNNNLLIILLASLLLIGGIIFSNYVSFANVQEVLTEQVRANQLTETAFIAGKIEHHVLEMRTELTVLSTLPEENVLSLEKCRVQTNESSLFNGKITSILKADAEGNIVACSSSQFSGFMGLNIKNKDYFAEPMMTHEPFMSDIIYQGSPKIMLSIPLFEEAISTQNVGFEGKFTGVLLTVIEVKELFSLYVHPYVDERRNFFILFNPESEETLLKSTGFQDYSEIKNELFERKDLNVITAYNGWGDTIITSADIVLGEQRHRLMIFTPLENTSVDLVSLQTRHLFSLFFILLVALLTTVFFVSLYRSREQVQKELEHATVTLKKLGIQSGIEKKRYADADIVLATRKVYVLQEDEENHAHELFIASLNRGFAGLGIVREDPENFTERYNLEKTSFIWLTNAEVSVPAETRIAVLVKLITQFITENARSVILLERLDYLTSENDFASVLKSVHVLADVVAGHECILLLSMNSASLTSEQVSALEAEAVDVYGLAKNKVNLNDSERAILELVNTNNAQNRLVSYKDITAAFKITKPTTRARIRKLQAAGLVRVEQVGRFKSLKITSAGRRFLR